MVDYIKIKRLEINSVQISALDCCQLAYLKDKDCTEQ